MKMYRIVFALATLLLCPVTKVLQAETPHVLLISIDGMKPEYVTQAAQHGLHLPTLERFLREGTYADGVAGVVPTYTYPSHTTLITGVWPAEHGIYNNSIFDPMKEHPGEWNAYFDAIKVKTLYQAVDEAGMKTAAVGWPVTVGAPIDYLIAEYARSEAIESPRGHIVHPADLYSSIHVTLPAGITYDEKKTLWTIGIIDTFDPNLVMLHLSDLDSAEHRKGPFTPEANKALEVIDEEVNRVMQAEWKKHPKAKVVIVSDHGFVKIEHSVPVNRYLANAGLIKLTDGPKPDIASWDAYAWEAGGTAAIMLKNSHDKTLLERTAAVLNKLASDPANGIERVIGPSEIAAYGGFPDASFLLDFKPGWTAAGGFNADRQGRHFGGNHGYLPGHPELRASFMAMGHGIAKHRDLGIIDMRQVAPTLAKMLGVKLPRAKQKPVQY
ncbi:MAG: alkaline phosphatase family protein [Acidobacteria bacterium]|nr:alkaline phosphatase family protein [Acidobacteriota bacterium]